MGWFSASIGDTRRQCNVTCSVCGGSGFGGGRSADGCNFCDGTGKYEETQTYSKCYSCDNGKIKKEVPRRYNVKFTDNNNYDTEYRYLDCTKCGGKGALWR